MVMMVMDWNVFSCHDHRWATDELSLGETDRSGWWSKKQYQVQYIY